MPNKINMKKLGKKLKKRLRKEIVQRAKEEHIGKKLSRELKSQIRGAVQSGLATGSGAYGRGAYGRGSYSQSGQVAVNSLFDEYAHRRHETHSHMDETERVTVSRREYVMRVTAPPSTEFTNTSFSINPGQSGVFAWLSQIAANYSEYELKHLIFHYKPVISQASQTGTMGSVLLSCNYNAGDEKFASFREMAEYVGTLETRICDEAMFGVECDPRKHPSQAVEYIRAGAVPAGQDIKTYDLGTFQLATSDVDSVSFPSGTLLGHLYVEYEVMLGKPKLYTALGKAILEDMFRSVVGVSTGANLGTTILANPNNNMGCTAVGGTITFPGNFYGTVTVCIFLNATTVTGVASTVGGEVTIVNNLGPNGNVGYEFATSGVVDYMQRRVLRIAPAVGATPNTITFANGIVGGLGVSVSVVQINPDLSSWS